MSERRILENWKAIAGYLGHTAQTCRKWEHELGLPVHRLDDSPKAHVFAYADELDRWKEEKALPERIPLARRLLGLGRKAGFWLIACSAGAVLAIVGLLVWPTGLAKRAPGPQKVKTVAVLPFLDLSPGKDQEPLADGIADILTNALNGIEGLRTPARISAFYFKGKNASPEEIGRKLKVEWILDGSVQIHENRLRVVASLLSAADGYQLWTERYDRSLSDIFAVEDEIARRIVENLKVKIIGDTGAPLVKPGTTNLEAYNLFLAGRYYMKKGWFTLRQAIEFYEKALEEDPNYAEPYAEIAVSYVILARNGLIRPAEGFAKARTAALRALEIDSRNPYARGALSVIKMTYDWDFPGAESDVQEAIRYNPKSSFLHGCYANLLFALARFEEGLAELELALRQDPLSLEPISSPWWQYYLARKYDLALEGMKKALELDPQNGGTYIVLVQIYLSMGRYEDARAVNQRRSEVLGAGVLPDDLEPWNAMVDALTGHQARAREILADLKDHIKEGDIHVGDHSNDFYPYHKIAWVHAALGEKDEAFYWLEKAYQERSGAMYLLKVYPLADPLRDDPRFKDLLRRIGLEK